MRAVDISVARLRLRRPDDWHLHLRDGDALHAVVGHTARQFARAIVMPNLKPPVTTVASARAYAQRIKEAVEAAARRESDPSWQAQMRGFQALMTLYLTDNTPASEIREGAESGVVTAVKLYPAGATTNSDSGVTDLLQHCDAALEAMQEVGMPLLIHGEVTDGEIDLFDREAVFIDRVLIPLRARFPALKVVFEHITTQEAAHYVRDADGPIAATITAHHLLYNRNALFTGGLQPHWYCLPVLKREVHRQALISAAVSGNPRFFLGTDSAPHGRGLKEAACGCAGCYTALHALELYAQLFEAHHALDRFEGFASVHGPQFYGLPLNSGWIELKREPWIIPDAVPFGPTELVPLAAGSELAWKVAAVSVND